MKISQLKYENFRNFKDYGIISFPVDGKVTIIYGTNGDGKTTLHQLFQWIIYGEVHFNKTAGDEMYNLQYEHALSVGTVFSVKGTIDFEHTNAAGETEYYTISREWKYRKKLQRSEKIEEHFSLLKKNEDNDWKKVHNPAEIIEEVLPSALSQYFFFDGESMIADLNVKGKDSAKTLRSALYSIFDMDIYEQAKQHIGDTSLQQTVLGKLYLEKSEGSTDSAVIIAKGELRQAQTRLQVCRDEALALNRRRDELRARIAELSEKIGSTKSRQELESRRKDEKANIAKWTEFIKKEQLAFGADVSTLYPYLLASQVIKHAQERIGLKVGEEKLIRGVTKPLIDALLKEPVCLCGHCIGDQERSALEKQLRLLPPLSYKGMYDNFTQSASRWSTEYDPQKLAQHIATVISCQESIIQANDNIRRIDEDLKQSEDLQGYIVERKKAEDSVQSIDAKLRTIAENTKQYELLVRQKMKKLNALTESSGKNKVIDEQIAVMTEVANYFSQKLQEVAVDYSKRLKNAIQSLLDQMLTSKRSVFVSPDFQLKVQDSYGNEAKSEGQFAVVSFAYIGGIFKLIQSEPLLRGKEFPLVLDGPFSKLDAIQRQNVINTIPQYAPQIILFSKDDITSCFAPETIGGIWTLFSNEEKNVTVVKQGYFREVFGVDGNNN